MMRMIKSMALGMGIVGRTVVGSVADALVHNARCTVTVVKGKY